jgi:hypothetical protein
MRTGFGEFRKIFTEGMRKSNTMRVYYVAIPNAHGADSVAEEAGGK